MLGYEATSTGTRLHALGVSKQATPTFDMSDFRTKTARCSPRDIDFMVLAHPPPAKPHTNRGSSFPYVGLLP